jgi:hypothetical protein
MKLWDLAINILCYAVPYMVYCVTAGTLAGPVCELAAHNKNAPRFEREYVEA